MKKTALTIITLAALSPSTYALCSTLKECITQVSKLTNKTYLYDESLEGKKAFASPDFKLTKDNADFFMSLALNKNDFTRIPVNDNNTFQVINARDVRYSPAPIINDHSKLPSNYDYIQTIIDLKHIDANDIVRTMRPFLSRYGRIMTMKSPKRILIQDTSINLKRFINIIQSSDIPLSKEQKRMYAKRKKFNEKLKLIQAKSCRDKS